MRLTWVQPEDLIGHELVASRHLGRSVAPVEARWLAAGGAASPPVGGASTTPVSPELRSLAAALLEELEALPTPPDPTEPDDLPSLCTGWPAEPALPAAGPDLADRVHGAWLWRAVGCLLGKPVEKIPRRGIREILEATGRWPLSGYFTEVGLPAEVAARWPWNRRSRPTSLAENIDGMPEDDDLNFPLLALRLLETRGREFTAADVAALWLENLPAGRVFTAERVAYRNLLSGLLPPATATTRNPFREWIGAQIRTDLYGWVNPGNPAAAAELAWRDATVSHVRNGIYGALYAAGLAAAAVVASDVDEVLDAAAALLPPHSRLASAVRFARRAAAGTTDFETVVDALYERYGDLHWVHVLNNAALVTAALVHGRGDPVRSICAVVSGGWDTDSNGATVGSVTGGLAGARRLPGEWTGPLRNRLRSSLAGFDGVGFDALAARTVALAGSGPDTVGEGRTGGPGREERG